VAELELVRQFDQAEVLKALEGWHWLPEVHGKQAWFASPFGDLFLLDDDGSVWYLDLVGGGCERVWDDVEACERDVSTSDGLDQYLLAGIAEAAADRGVLAGAQQVLTFTLPPVLGGEMTVENVGTVDFVVGVDIAGQIHEQVRALPPGTPISGFTVD
jgi:hypothetical protein